VAEKDNPSIAKKPKHTLQSTQILSTCVTIGKMAYISQQTMK